MHPLPADFFAMKTVSSPFTWPARQDDVGLSIVVNRETTVMHATRHLFSPWSRSHRLVLGVIAEAPPSDGQQNVSLIESGL